METITTITKPAGNLINNEAIKNCLEYSEKPEELKALLSDLSINSEYLGLSKRDKEDSYKRMILSITIKRKSRAISFEFWASINSSVKFFLDQYDFKEIASVLCPYKKKYPEIEDAIRKHRFKLSKTRKEIFNGILYSVLSCSRSDYYCPISFKEFCDEFGYNNDSITDKNIWEKCLEQSSKLHKIFTEDEIDCLPS
jgi:hypothetical protein